MCLLALLASILSGSQKDQQPPYDPYAQHHPSATQSYGQQPGPSDSTMHGNGQQQRFDFNANGLSQQAQSPYNPPSNPYGMQAQMSYGQAQSPMGMGSRMGMGTTGRGRLGGRRGMLRGQILNALTQSQQKPSMPHAQPAPYNEPGHVSQYGQGTSDQLGDYPSSTMYPPPVYEPPKSQPSGLSESAMF